MQRPNPRSINRRAFLAQGAAGLSAATMTGGEVLSAASPEAKPSLIEKENAKRGSLDWQLTYVRLDSPKSLRCSAIEGYCLHQSVAVGDKLEIMVSTNPPGRFRIEIFRMGYYGGRGARKMAEIGPLDGKAQPVPEVGPRRLRECRWEPAAGLTIPQDWPSGVYLGRLSREPNADGTDPWQSYVVFIVRDERPADVLFQCSDNTWQAYNRWPDTFSLYDNGKGGWVSGPEVAVSFDRPYGKYRQIYDNPQSLGSGEFLCWEFPLCYWLEKEGYDVTYCSNGDMVNPERGKRCKTFISVGHDEYWDLRQYESVKAMLESGTSALYLSGNSVCWVTPMTESSDGRPKRIITREAPYYGLSLGDQPLAEGFDYVGPDEGLIMGARNIRILNGGGDWVCEKPNHWMFDGTGLKRGDRIPGLVGWEFHRMPPDIAGLEVVGQGMALHAGTKPTPWQATIFPTEAGGLVFNASTIFWAQGLASPPGHMLPWSHNVRPHGPDPRVQQMTRNLLKRAIGSQ